MGSCPLSVRLVLSVVTAISRLPLCSSSPVTVSLCSPQSASRASWSSPVCPPSPRFSPLVLMPPPALTSHSVGPHPLELELLHQPTLLPFKPTLLPRLL